MPKKLPDEKKKVRTQGAQIGLWKHKSIYLTFFNELTQLLTRHFHIIVKNWIVDENKKKVLQEGYDEWMRNPNEVKQFWLKWHLKSEVKDRMDMSISEASTLTTETATIASNSTNATTDLLKNYLSSDITTTSRQPYCVNGFNVSQAFYNW